jgi:hypothetical protein
MSANAKNNNGSGAGGGGKPVNNNARGNNNGNGGRRFDNNQRNKGPTRSAWNKSNESIKGNASSNTPSPSGTPSGDADHASKHMHDRLTYLLAKSVGFTAIVTVVSGARYRGIFSAATGDAELGVVLKCATKFASAPGEEENKEVAEAAKKEWYEELVISPKDMADIKFEHPDLTPDKASDSSGSSAAAVAASAGSGGGFKTDTDISGNQSGFFERELQPWKPEEGDLPEATLEESVSGHVGNWDQFAVNEQKFGVQSTYDEHYYTTAINKNLPNYEEIEKKAEKIAAEITSSGSGGNAHLAEERGRQVDDSGLDEEDKYSGVDRGTKQQASNKYTPPALRPPSGNKGGVGGMPYDPAIISSSLATPDGKLNAKTENNNNGPSKGGLSKGGIEKELAGNFRQFVSGEVERLHQKKQYLQKREKSERLHDFKKFSEDYKITAPVPPDLIPILAKGKDKQEKILQKAAANASAANSPDLKHATPENPSPQQQPALEKSPYQHQTEKKPAPKKFNFNVPEFKPNPSAHSFTPGQSAAGLAAATTSESPGSPHVRAASRSPAVSSHASPSQQGGKPAAAVQQDSGSNSRTPTPSTFFGKGGPSAKSRNGKFNPFKRQEKVYNDALVAIEQAKAKNEEPPQAPHHMIERAWVQGPTWNPGPSDKSYTTIFPTPENITPRPFMMGSMSPRGFPAANMVPMMQPGLEDPNMRPGGPMMSPSPIPGQVFPAGFIPAGMGYPQYMPQYYGRPGGDTPQPFMASPQMMGQAIPAMYAPQQAYGATSPRGPDASMVPPQPMYYQGGGMPQQQQPHYGNPRQSHHGRHNSNQPE